MAGDRAAYTYLPQSVDYFLQADNLAALFQQVGLVEVSYHKLGFWHGGSALGTETFQLKSLAG